MIERFKAIFNNLSIKYKFIVGITSILILSIPLLSIVFITNSENSLEDALENKVNLLNSNFSVVSGNALQEYSFSFLQQLIKEVAVKDREVVDLVVMDSNGTIYATNNDEKYMTFSLIQIQQIKKAIKEEKELPIFHNEEENRIESIKFIHAKKAAASPEFPQFYDDKTNKENTAIQKNEAGMPAEKSDVIGMIYLTLTKKYLQESVRKLWVYSLIFTLVLLGIGIVAAYFTGREITRPITLLTNNVREIASGNLDASIVSSSTDEIGRLVSDVESMRVSIKDLTENLEAKVEERTEQLQEANEKLSRAMEEIWGEMELAKKIQTVLLPEKPAINGFDVSAYMEPADEVGGDYYDIINAGDMDWIVIGDVSGHGVPAGLIMMMVQTSIRVTLAQNKSLEPSKLLSIINKTISYNIKQMGEDKYMTITVMAAHKNGEFIFSGLHQDILIYNSGMRRVDTVETSGMWLGIIDEIDGLNQNESLKLNVGDVMLVFTDGITEA
ncbi:MAG: SpoIIE family protein phosphatase, partial [Spirochaetes bacterium]|nr:SpoIIE family protein phosphatase [Spirochaetota bacterium]